VLGDGDGLEHGLAEVGESGGHFGLDLALGDGGEEPGHGSAQIASGKQIREKESGYVFSGLFCGQGFGFLLSVEVAEMRVAGAMRSAALAAIGKGESTQTGTVLFRFCRKADVLLRGRRAVFYMRGRKTANGAVCGHGSPSRIKGFEL
jgi:hypothetical protein